MIIEKGGLVSLKELTSWTEKNGIGRRTFRNCLQRLMYSKTPAIAISRSLTGEVVHLPDVATDLELFCILLVIFSQLITDLHNNIMLCLVVDIILLVSLFYRFLLGRYIRHKYNLTNVTKKMTVSIMKYVTQKDGKKVRIDINGNFKGSTKLSEIKKYACMKLYEEYGIAVDERDHLLMKGEKSYKEDMPLYMVCSSNATFRLVRKKNFLGKVTKDLKDLLEKPKTPNELDLFEYSRRKDIPFYLVQDAAMSLERTGDYEIKIRGEDNRMILCKK